MNIVQKPEVWLSTCVASSPNSSLLQVLVVFLRLWNQSLLAGSCWFLVFSLTWSSSARAFPPSTPCFYSSKTRQAFFLCSSILYIASSHLSIPEMSSLVKNYSSVQMPQNYCTNCTIQSTTPTTTSMMPEERWCLESIRTLAWNNEIFVAQLLWPRSAVLRLASLDSCIEKAADAAISRHWTTSYEKAALVLTTLLALLDQDGILGRYCMVCMVLHHNEIERDWERSLLEFNNYIYLSMYPSQEYNTLSVK